ncbi:MAG: hypothetical protein ACRDO4_00170 [Nocardioides sp.]
MSRVLVVAALLVMATVSGCGSGAERRAAAGPVDTRPEQPTFCESYVAHLRSIAEAGWDDVEERARLTRAWADEVEGGGLPDDMGPDAREGFDLLAELVRSVGPDPTPEELARLTEEPDGPTGEKLDAFSEYVGTACPEVDAVLEEIFEDRALDAP